MHQIPQDLGEKLNGISAEEAPPDSFSHVQFSWAQLAIHTHQAEDCSPLCAAHTGAGGLPEGTCSFPFSYVTCTSSFCSSAVRCMAQNRGKAHLKVCGVPLIPSLWAFKGKRRILTRMDQQTEIHFSLWYQGLPPFLAAPSCPPAACARSAVGQCEQGQGYRNW